jgi:O-antigen ligase
VLGVGPGGFPRAYAEVRLPAKQFLPDTNLEPPPHAHNLEMHVLAEQGIVGLATFVALLAVAATEALRLRRSADRELRVLGSAALAALVAFVLHSQFEFPFFDEPTTVFFWGLLGLIAALASARARGALP